MVALGPEGGVRTSCGSHSATYRGPRMAAHQEMLIDGPLTVAWDRFGQRVIVVSLHGELDGANVGSARGVIGEVTTGDAEEILVIVLSALKFIDSSGISLLVSLAAADGEEHTLRIVPSKAPSVSRIMRVTGVDAMVKIAREPPVGAA